MAFVMNAVYPSISAMQQFSKMMKRMAAWAALMCVASCVRAIPEPSGPVSLERYLNLNINHA